MDFNFTGQFLEEPSELEGLPSPLETSELNLYQTGEAGLHREYHVSLHPMAKLDGIGETEGGGWVGQGRWAANYSVSCLALNLDFVPSEEQQRELHADSFCRSLVYLRALFEPTVLLFGIPGNLVAIKACLSMSPLRPACIFLALISFGDLCSLISYILPMESSYFLQQKGHVNFYWFMAFEAVAAALPHYALAALTIERASVAWRPVLAGRLITVLRAEYIGVALLIISLIFLPLEAKTASSEYVSLSVWEMHILVMVTALPSSLILVSNAVMLVGLLIRRTNDRDDESIVSQISIILSQHSVTQEHPGSDIDTRKHGSYTGAHDKASIPVVTFSVVSENRDGPSVEIHRNPSRIQHSPLRPTQRQPRSREQERNSRQISSQLDDIQNSSLRPTQRQPRSREQEKNSSLISRESDVDIEPIEPSEPNVLSVLHPKRSILTVWSDSDVDDGLPKKRLGVSKSRNFGLEQMASSSDNRASTVDDERFCPSLCDHSSLTRMSLLASLSFFLMEWPLIIVTLAYNSARGGDKIQPVRNPLAVLRLLYLYELFAWVSSLHKAVKLYMYLLAAPRFRKHFVHTMMRRPRGTGTSTASAQSHSYIHSEFSHWLPRSNNVDADSPGSELSVSQGGTHRLTASPGRSATTTSNKTASTSSAWTRPTQQSFLRQAESSSVFGSYV